jgi:hypothetical protein
MNQRGLEDKFHSTLPYIREWIETTIEEYKDKAVPVSDFEFARIKKIFPHKLLRKTKAVVVTGKIPFPPLARLGLTELVQIENMSIAGITYKDTFFVGHLYQTESLFFHELVHIVQWDRLGVDDFLLAYGAGLMQFGYEDSPFEKMAYSLQTSFDNETLPENIVEVIHDRTDAIWEGVASSFPKA